MTSRPAPKRRAEKPKKGFRRPNDPTSAEASAETEGRRVAGRTTPPEGDVTRAARVEPTPLPETPSPSETTLIRSEVTAARTEIASPSTSETTERPAIAASAADDSASRRTPTPAGGRRRAAGPAAVGPELPPIPADATTQISAYNEHTTITERRAGELRSARRPSAPGARSARTRQRRRLPVPAPAVVGAAALVLAGVGAIGFSSTKPPVMETVDYSALASDVSGTGAKRADPNDVDVTRDFDRALYQKQVEAQAEQKKAALKELAGLAEARSKEIKLNSWVLPLTGYRLTARFGQSSSLWSTVHTGLDFAAPSGTPLVAIARGTITSTGYDGAYGNRTVLTLDDGTEIWYCHQSRIGATVGEKVEPGTRIGYVGSTGNVTGPHLHLEVRPNPTTPIDPLPALRAHNVNP